MVPLRALQVAWLVSLGQKRDRLLPLHILGHLLGYGTGSSWKFLKISLLRGS